MARRPGKPIRPAGCRGDEHGQMMVLSAVLLVISFVALAAMVSRVNQLGSQTASESRKVILDEVGPLADSLNSGIRSLGGSRDVASVIRTLDSRQISTVADSFYPEDVGRHITGTGIPLQATIESYQSAKIVLLSDEAESGGTNTVTIDRVSASIATTGVVSPSANFFTAEDVGKALTQVTGTGLPAGARIISYNSVPNPDQVTISPAPTSALASQSFNVGDFALSTTTTPTMEDAVLGMLDQMQNLLSSRGLWMDYSIACGTGGVASASYAQVRLWDGQVWLTVESTATFARADCLPATVSG